MNSVIQNMLKKYEINNITEETNALKEIIQEIVLCALSKNGFFNEAAFYGGTALRIFYGLDRFSEDLDFALLSPDTSYSLEKYFKAIEEEAKTYGLNFEVSNKEKSKEKDSNIKTAFLKGDAKEHILMFFPDENMEGVTSLKNIKIKFEVDINPPSGATYDFKYRLLPSPYEIRLYDEVSLFAGKIHAILCRNWANRVKGRDLYDYIFYLSRNTKVNLELLKQKLIASNMLNEADIFDINILRKMLEDRFKKIDYEDAKQDVLAFIHDASKLNIWSEKFFCEVTKELK